MGQAGPVRCEDCGHGFQLTMGGGFQVQVVFCENCGRGESLSHFDKPLHEQADDSGCFGGCSRCKGRLMLDASARCPRRRSMRVEIGAMAIDWD